MYLGLSAQEFADIHESVAEAMAYVAIPVVFYKADTTTTGVHPLYQEAVGGTEDWSPYATLRGSVNFKPEAERLQRMGLRTNVDVLVFIPRKSILDHDEANPGNPFMPDESMDIEVQGVRYNITKLFQDVLPVGDGSTQDYIGLLVAACTKPAKK